jgi:hypothetical protein
MPFVLRKPGDTENPRLVRVFGSQSTTGRLCYYNKTSNRTGLINFLGEGEKFGEGEFDGIDWYRYRGLLITPYDPATGLGDYIFHSGKESTGFGDANQGRPHFFPELDFTFSGKAYVEVMLPAALSDETDEPSNSEIRVRGSRINDYDNTGAVIGGNYGPSANNLREFIYCCKLARKLTPSNMATRVDWPSYVDARAKADEQIGWAAGGGDGLKGDYYTGDNFGSLALSRIDGQVSFAFGTDQADLPAVPFTVRWTGFVEAPVTGTYTFRSTYDDGIRLWINGVQIINDWTVGPARESTGTIALTVGTKYSVTLEYLNAVGTGEVNLSFECGSSLAKQLIPRDALFSTSTISTAGRTVNRYDGDIVFPGTPLPSALAAIMSKCPGIDWQEVNGKIRFLSDTARASVFTFYYDPTQSTTPANIVAKSFIGAPRDPTTKPNFLIVGYRDKDDDVFTQKYVPIDRSELRDQLNGQLVDAGILQIGVARQSLAERIGEATMRLATDLDLDCTVKGQKGAHKVAKADRVTLVHPVGDWRGTAFAGHSGPIDMLVDAETFESTIETANEKTFKLREYDPAFYSDTDHGPLLRKRIVDVGSPYDRPPVATSITLREFAGSIADGSLAITIEGDVQFADWGYEQRGRLWWRRPNDYIGDVTADASTNIISKATPFDFGDNQPVELVANGGTLPAPLVEDKTYYALLQGGGGIKLSLKPDGDAIDLTTAGVAPFLVAPYFAVDTLLVPNKTSLQASFELSPAELGVHKVRVASESLLQQTFEVSVHPVATITISPVLVLPGAAQYIDNVFTVALLRAATPVEKTKWLRAMQVANLTDLIAATQVLDMDLFEGAQYVARGRTNTQFVDDLYFGILGREPDASAADWVAALVGGETRHNVIHGFTFSTEFQTKRIPRLLLDPMDDQDVPQIGAVPVILSAGTEQLSVFVFYPVNNATQLTNVQIRARRTSDHSQVWSDVTLGVVTNQVIEKASFDCDVDYRWRNNYRGSGSDGWSAWSGTSSAPGTGSAPPPTPGSSGPIDNDPNDSRKIKDY